MAARRLIVVMIVLLLASSVAAALVPIPESADEASTTTTTTAPATASGESLLRTLRADAEKPQTIEVDAGDQLTLEVVGSAHDLVEIPALGELEDVDLGSPARFNLLLDQPGTYAVRLAEAGLIGRIEVRQGRAESDRPSAPSEPVDGALS